MNALQYIRDTYKVPAIRGGRIICGATDGEELEAVIIGGRDGRLRARYIGDDGAIGKRTVFFHPTERITYL
jgi:hypothetical protein